PVHDDEGVASDVGGEVDLRIRLVHAELLNEVAAEIEDGERAAGRGIGDGDEVAGAGSRIEGVPDLANVAGAAGRGAEAASGDGGTGGWNALGQCDRIAALIVDGNRRGDLHVDGGVVVGVGQRGGGVVGDDEVV